MLEYKKIKPYMAFRKRANGRMIGVTHVTELHDKRIRIDYGELIHDPKNPEEFLMRKLRNASIGQKDDVFMSDRWDPIG